MGPFPKNVSYRIKSVRKKLILVSLTIKIKSMLREDVKVQKKSLIIITL